MPVVRGWFAVFATLCLFVAPLRADPYSSLFIFGDSLSDPGNAYTASGGSYPPAPPYWQGRFSNGPTWVEQFAANQGLAADSIYFGGTNYAFGGALTKGVSPYGTPSLQEQVGMYQLGNPVADPNALYIVWSGANDPLLAGATDPAASAQNVRDAVDALAQAGAKQFLVVNQPSLGNTPLLKGTPLEAGVNLFSAGFNAALESQMQNLESTHDVTIHRLDSNALFADMLANPAKYGFSNVMSDALTDGVYTGEGYLFWDTVHPTTVGHGFIAQAALNAVKSPEPATLFLAATAGAGLLGLRRCRAGRDSSCRA